MSQALLSDLQRLTRASQQADDLLAYGRDWTRNHQPNPVCICWPGHGEEVAAVLQYCSQRGLAVVPSGGRTGLVGGAVASEGEVVLSLERLQSIGSLDPFGLTLQVGAGVTTEQVHRELAPSGLTWPIDLAAKGSSQIGGNLATNAGGVRVIRYGPTRQWVTGLEAVLMDGRILKLGGALHKDNAGPNLAQLLIGSEGIFGVITSATLRLTPLPTETQVLLLGLDRMEVALDLLRSARQQARLQLQALEYFSRACLEAVMRVHPLGDPLSSCCPAYALFEVEGPRDARFESWLESSLSLAGVRDGVLAQSHSDARALWQYRERITESLAHLGLMHKTDVAVAVADLPEFASRLEGEVAPAFPGQLYLFGHVGDGNLHVNVMKPPDLDPTVFWEQVSRADQQLYGLLQSMSGSVSAEHGIGLLKKKALPFSRGPQEIEAMRQLKRALDPQGLLNPGKVFDP